MVQLADTYVSEAYGETLEGSNPSFRKLKGALTVRLLIAPKPAPKLSQPPDGAKRILARLGKELQKKGRFYFSTEIRTVPFLFIAEYTARLRLSFGYCSFSGKTLYLIF